jgi:hypothetical protein
MEGKPPDGEKTCSVPSVHTSAQIRRTLVVSFGVSLVDKAYDHAYDRNWGCGPQAALESDHGYEEQYRVSEF